jgi:hypothetical protein
VEDQHDCGNYQADGRSRQHPGGKRELPGSSLGTDHLHAGEVVLKLGLCSESIGVAGAVPDRLEEGVKRYTTYRYPVTEYDEGLKEGVLLELGSRGGTHPAGLHSNRSMVADYAITELGETEDTWEEFASFMVNVLAPERTLLEKIAAVHDAATRGDTDTLLRHGRHFYDIDRLLNTSTVIEALDAQVLGNFAGRERAESPSED